MRYFKKPTIKISHATRLNDPFEKIIPEDLIGCALNPFKALIQSRNKGAEIDGYDQYTETMNTAGIINLIRRLGVVSLTETPRNLLMWSHYANNHTGLCIGYRSDFLDEHKSRKHALLPTEFTPIKVNYDDSRYDEHTEALAHSDVVEIRKEILKRTLLKKSNDWIYEKEHRSIIPLEYNDQATCLNNRKSDEFIQKYMYFKKIDNENFKPIHLVEHFASPIYDEKDLMFTININPSSIQYVYFGCESDIYRNIDVFNLISSTDSLSHIKVFQMEANKNRFELNPIPFEEYLTAIRNGTKTPPIVEL